LLQTNDLYIKITGYCKQYMALTDVYLTAKRVFVK